MFGLTFEKLLIIGIIAAVVVGPAKLPRYAAMLADFVRKFRSTADGAKARIKEELGPDFDDIEWRKLDPRQYDPRQIIRSALLDAPEPIDTQADAPRVIPAVKDANPGPSVGGFTIADNASTTVASIPNPELRDDPTT